MITHSAGITSNAFVVKVAKPEYKYSSGVVVSACPGFVSDDAPHEILSYTMN